MKHTLNLVKNDARTITGSNLRNILLMTGLARVEDLTTESVADIEHNHILGSRVTWTCQMAGLMENLRKFSTTLVPPRIHL